MSIRKPCATAKIGALALLLLATAAMLPAEETAKPAEAREKAAPAPESFVSGDGVQYYSLNEFAQPAKDEDMPNGYGYMLAGLTGARYMFARVARNETFAYQLVIRSEKTLKDVSVTLTPFEGTQAQPECTLYLVHYDKADYGKPRPGKLIPFANPFSEKHEPVVQNFSLDPATGHNQAIWIDLKLPPNILAGKFFTTIQLRGADNYSQDIRLAVRVMDDFPSPNAFPTSAASFAACNAGVDADDGKATEAIVAGVPDGFDGAELAALGFPAVKGTLPTTRTLLLRRYAQDAEFLRIARAELGDDEVNAQLADLRPGGKDPKANIGEFRATLRSNLAGKLNIAALKRLTQEENFEYNGHTIKFRIYKPETQEGVKYPLILQLHGAGAGDTIAAIGNNLPALCRYMKRTGNYAFMIFPLCPKDMVWHTMNQGNTDPEPNWVGRACLALCEATAGKYPIDRCRLYVEGFSMGGYGTWSMIQYWPDYFAAAMPGAGRGDLHKAEIFMNIPIWCFHGDQDNLITVEHSRKMYELMQKIGGKMKYTEMKGVGHWAPYLDEDATWDWLFAQKKETPAPAVPNP